MADAKITALNTLDNTTVAAADLVPVVDISANETKAIRYDKLMTPEDIHFRITGSADPTKKVAFEVDGLTTATTRTLTISDEDGTVVTNNNTVQINNKTLGTSTKVAIGSDATGDIYYRNASGNLTRLPLGSTSQVLQVGASSAPEWASNPAASDGSTTVKGVFEEATSAEINAGTATGGTGARLAVTAAGLAASAPTFSALNLTNVKPTISLSAASGQITGTGVATTQNIDTAITMNGTAKTICIDFKLKGFSGAGSPTYTIGKAVFDGTTIKHVFYSKNNSTSTTIDATTYTIGNTSPTAGDGGAGNGTWTMSIQSLTTTGFTFRLTYTQGSTFNGGDYYAGVTAFL